MKNSSLYNAALDPKFQIRDDAKSESAGGEPFLTTPNWPDVADATPHFESNLP